MASAAAVAATPPPTAGPITVIVPATSSPSPSPSSNGGGGGSTGGSGETPDDDGAGAPSCAATNADGSPTPAATPTADALELDVDRERLIAGEWIITRSEDFLRGEKAQIVMYPGAVVIGSFTVDAPTGFAARFRIPEGTLVGQYQLEATGWTSCAVANSVVTIVSGPAPTPAAVVWWPYAVLGSLGLGFVSLALAFRAQIALWFAASAATVTVR
jgi:hypothetical protein